jgi:hypothetical protein
LFLNLNRALKKSVLLTTICIVTIKKPCMSKAFWCFFLAYFALRRPANAKPNKANAPSSGAVFTSLDMLAVLGAT